MNRYECLSQQWYSSATMGKSTFYRIILRILLEIARLFLITELSYFLILPICSRIKLWISANNRIRLRNYYACTNSIKRIMIIKYRISISKGCSQTCLYFWSMVRAFTTWKTEYLGLNLQNTTLGSFIYIWKH